jgi:protein O-GlcNAc transferase
MRLAVAAHKVDLLDEAIVNCQRVLELDPLAAAAHNTLASCYQLLGRSDEAITAFREAVRLLPESAALHSNLLYALNYVPGLAAADVFAEHRRWAMCHAESLTAAAARVLPRPDRARLRLGYVSAHFKDHAVNFFVEPVLASHDHERFEVYCYSNSTRSDPTSERLRKYADHWREIRLLTDEQASAAVREDEIDVLIDLDGHIGGNRLMVFARRPAPVQATYIGYQNTTGMSAMDYRITDDWSDPPGMTDALYTESLVRLPQCFFCYQPSTDAPPVAEQPAVKRSHVTFGSFNNFTKITPQVLATWAELLHAVPTARLTMLVTVTASSRKYLQDTFTAHGIAPERIELCRRRPRGEYLQLINQVDIALDPFPFNGHTTTCDCLWQGVPVVTWAGAAYVSRFGSSAHRSLGLLDLAADTRENYLAIAARLAADVDRLVELRRTLRDRMAASALLDHVGFTRRLEDAYRNMHATICQRS